MCSSTPLRTAMGAVGPGCWDGCMVRVTVLPRFGTASARRLVSERRLVAAGGRLGRLTGPARPVAGPGRRRRRRRLGLGRWVGLGPGRGGRAGRREPQAHANLLGVDLDGRAALALRGLPGAALEPADDHTAGPLVEAPADVLGLVTPDAHPEVGRLAVLPPVGVPDALVDREPEVGHGHPVGGEAQLRVVGQVAGEGDLVVAHLRAPSVVLRRTILRSLPNIRSNCDIHPPQRGHGRVWPEQGVLPDWEAGMIELAEVIAELRRELQEAMNAGEGEQLRFELGPVELEATVAVEKSGGGGVKVRFWVIEVGGDAKVGEVSTHRVKLALQPRQAGGGRVWVASDAAPGER